MTGTRWDPLASTMGKKNKQKERETYAKQAHDQEKVRRVWSRLLAAKSPSRGGRERENQETVT